MKKEIHPRPDIDERLVRPFREMEDVLSLSCVVGDAMERCNIMHPDIKPRAADKRNSLPSRTDPLSWTKFVLHLNSPTETAGYVCSNRKKQC